jgi:hypothetical protein
MSTSKSKLSVIMAVYIGIHLAGIIYNLNFTNFTVNEICGRNRSSIRETGGTKKIGSNMRVIRNYGRNGHPVNNY